MLTRPSLVLVFVSIWFNSIAFSNVKDFSNLTKKDFLILGPSAITTPISWIFYYKAIKLAVCLKLYKSTTEV
jgi:uncharacterized membrane protein